MARLVVKLSPQYAESAAPFASPTPGAAFAFFRHAPAIRGFHDFLKSNQLTTVPLAGSVGISPPTTAMGGREGSEVNRFYYIGGASDDDLQRLAEEVAKLPEVEAAYLKPPAEAMRLRPPRAVPEAKGATTQLQNAGMPAPGGIGLEAMRSRPGGDGRGVTLIDLEGDWNEQHEVLVGCLDPRLSSRGVADADWGGARDGWTDHGTAVLSILGGNGSGQYRLSGLSPGVTLGAVSFFAHPNEEAGTAEAILLAAERLQPGDVILVEAHRAGPRFRFQGRADELGYIAIEWWDDDATAIRSVTERGIVVVEAAGNGGEDLSDALYDKPGANFPRGWQNPFRRGAADTGAILVGAGSTPRAPMDRVRLSFSNHGACCDVQSWGEEILAGGYGTFGTYTGLNDRYTKFGGTSGAAPIVAAAIACIQGARKAASLPVLTPAQVRAALRSTGAPQLWPGGTTGADRIGNRPSLAELLGWTEAPAGSAPTA